MLINSLGESLGMLSGGCLEGDLLLQARKVLMGGKSVSVEYDLRDESDSQWQKGLGCGGSVGILLQALDARTQYLGLENIHQGVLKKDSAVYHQRIDESGKQTPQWKVEIANKETVSFFHSGRTHIKKTNESEWLQTLISPSPHLLIFGGGLDAQPLAHMANTIGWQVTVVDGRQGYAKQDDFTNASIVNERPETLSASDSLKSVDAIVIMNHNIILDAQALTFAKGSTAKYVGILGPEHRRQKVEKAAGLSSGDFDQIYRGPIGIDIGAKLPETIALSILSECHLVVEGQASNTNPFTLCDGSQEQSI